MIFISLHLISLIESGLSALDTAVKGVVLGLQIIHLLLGAYLGSLGAGTCILNPLVFKASSF